MIRIIGKQNRSAQSTPVVSFDCHAFVFNGRPIETSDLKKLQTPVGLDVFDEGAQSINVRGDGARHVIILALPRRNEYSLGRDFQVPFDIRKFTKNIFAFVCSPRGVAGRRRNG